MSDTKLKPCPTCNHTDIWGPGNCGPRCGHCGTEAATIEIWNTRPREDALAAALEDMHAMAAGLIVSWQLDLTHPNTLARRSKQLKTAVGKLDAVRALLSQHKGEQS